jgi:hypothetical protein
MGKRNIWSIWYVADKKINGDFNNVFYRKLDTGEPDPLDNDDVAIDNINGNTVELLVVPEYLYGALTAMFACFIALMMYKETRHY